MSACARCGEDFTVRGTPWTWRHDDGERVHVDCDAPSMFRRPDGTTMMPPKPAQTYSIEPRRRSSMLYTRRVTLAADGWSRSFVVKYAGSRCLECGKQILRNTKAQHRKGDGRSVYRHEHCPGGAPSCSDGRPS